jgi:hypothetical protein
MRRSLQVACLSAVACAGPRTAGQPSPRAQLATLHDGWNRIVGPRGTGCAQDSTYFFFVRPGAPDKLMLYFNGGGACWRAEECDPRARPSYTMRADTANDPAMASGLFDVGNAANPVRDFTMVFVPYCTADVHLGTRTVRYESRGATDAPARSVAIRHQGAANAEAALDWTYEHLDPRVVFVTGSSAGAIPSPVFAAKVARHYPRSRVVQLGDGAGGYHAAAVPALLARWGAVDYLRRDPAFRSIDSAEFTFEALYTQAARAGLPVTYAQFNTADDATQLFFLSLLGIRGTPLNRFLAIDLEEIRRADPAFRSYVAPGRVHTILRSSAVYTTSVDGVRFRDWLAELIAGRMVADVGNALLSGPGG